ncbi:MAG: hypothetical protein K6G61_00245 [Solobacterium sp.]|nr:hypothetical protein [Solobacterium sp.]
MQKMKKSKVKPRSQRSIEMEEENKRIIAEMEEKKQKKENEKNYRFTIIASFYSLIFGIFSWLMDWFGVISLVSVIAGVIGLRLNKNNVRRERIAAIIGIVFGGLRLAQQIISYIGILQ